MKEHRDPRTFAIIGAGMQVHTVLGCGFLEAVYRDALQLEFADCKIPFASEVELPVFYKGRKLDTSYRADFVCFDSVIVELKAIAKLGNIEQAQILNYLKATNYPAGLLLNFGAASLEYKRFVFDSSIKSVKSE